MRSCGPARHTPSRNYCLAGSELGFDCGAPGLTFGVLGGAGFDDGGVGTVGGELGIDGDDGAGGVC